VDRSIIRHRPPSPRIGVKKKKGTGLQSLKSGEEREVAPKKKKEAFAN